MSPLRLTLLLVLASAVLHLLVAGGFELSGDEAHYALYGYHPAISYFDHPPLVGWLQALVLPVSDSEFALRLWPILLSVLSSLLLYSLTRELFPERPAAVAFIAVLLLQSALLFHLASLAMLPDTPLLPLGLATALWLHRALKVGGVSNWVLFGLFIGLAGLSKYTAITLALSAMLVILFEQRETLRQRGFWIAMVLAALIVSPVFIWNMQNDWISFIYQIEHGSPDKAWQLQRFLISQLGQFAGYGPAIYLFGLAAMVFGLRRRMESGVRFVLLFAVPPLVMFSWNSGYEPTLPHWTILAWTLLMPLTALWVYQHRERLWLRIAGGLSALYALALIILLHTELLVPWIPFEENRYPLGDLYGWEEVAQRAVALRSEMAATPGPEPVIFAGNWSFASHIAWYARPLPVQVTDDKYTQSDIWFGSPAEGGRGIVVVPYQFRNDRKANGLSRFASCREREPYAVKLNGKTAASYTLYSCTGYGR